MDAHPDTYDGGGWSWREDDLRHEIGGGTVFEVVITTDAAAAAVRQTLGQLASTVPGVEYVELRDMPPRRTPEDENVARSGRAPLSADGSLSPAAQPLSGSPADCSHRSAHL
jgi:hypothetical protein